MTNKIKWGGLAVLVYLLFLIHYLPASQIANRVPLPANSQISGVSGTLWQGRAQQVVVNGIVVQGLDWELSFLPLLAGKLDLDLDAGNVRDADQVSFNGELALSLTQPDDISAEDFSLFLPTAMVLAQVPLPLPVNAGGRLKVSLDELDYDQQCQQLTGKGEWLNAVVSGVSAPISLGSFAADLNCVDGNIIGKVSPPNSLGLDAEATIPSNWQFSISGLFKPDSSLPQEVHDAARFFGQPDSQGVIRFKL